MTSAAEIYGNGLKLSAYLAEGVFTRRDVIRDDGKISKGGTYSSEVSKGNLVQIWTDSWSGSDLIVTGAYTDSVIPTGSTYSAALGVVITTPEGPVPAVSSNGGTYTASSTKGLRRATVLFPGFASVIRYKVIEDARAGAQLGYDKSGAGFSTDSAVMTWKPYVLLESASAGQTKSVALGGVG